MPKSTSVSFRAQTTGAINDLLIAEQASNSDLQNLLVYFAGALLNYKDEGAEFSPSIVFCANISTFLQSFPGPVSYEIGIVPFDPSSGAQILKDCAPLSGDRWTIYIEPKDDKLHYGVFSYFRSPTALTLEDSMTLSATMRALLIKRTGPSTIGIRGSKGHSASFLFSTVLDPSDERPPIETFCRHCISDLDANALGDDFYGYFSRLLGTALSNSHGTILVCTKDKLVTDIPSMKDAVPLKPTLDFYQVFSDYQRQKTADSILDLQRCEELLFGFTRCDGIVAFDTKGQVRAYRVFFEATDKSKGQVKQVVGGARRRAFEGLKSLDKQHLIAALFRSQDGTTIDHEAT